LHLKNGLSTSARRDYIGGVKTITQDLLEEITQRLVTEFRPEQVWVFGSRAWGKPGEESDLDLFVIVAGSDERPIRRDQRAQKCLGRLDVSADVLVRTRPEVQRAQDVPGSLTAEVLRNGRKVYG
jgi:predicted nucleotidyltransferase